MRIFSVRNYSRVLLFIEFESPAPRPEILTLTIQISDVRFPQIMQHFFNNSIEPTRHAMQHLPHLKVLGGNPRWDG